jgi:predicted RNase H-like HicB family nuclease
VNDSATDYLINGAVLTAEDGGFVSFDPRTGVASQGETEAEALENLVEAVELFLEEFSSGQEEM